MRYLLAILALCSLSFAQTTIFPKTTVFPKTTIFGSAAAGGGLTLVAHCFANNTGICTINSTGANLITIEAIAGGLNAVTAPTENKSNTITAATGTSCAVGAGNGAVQIFYIFSPTVGTTHTFTGGAAQNVYFVQAWSGALTGSGVFDVGNNHCQTGGSTTLLPGSVTPAATNELAVSVALNDDNGTAWSIPTSPAFTLLDNSTGWGSETGAYYSDPSTSALNPTWNNTAAPNAGSAIALFKHP